MADAVHLNGGGRAHMDSLVAAGKVNRSDGWDLTSAERDGLDSNMFLGADTSVPEKDRGHWKYPFGKNGEVYRSALAAIQSRANAQGETEIADAAKAAADKIDNKKEMSAVEMQDKLKDREIFAAGKWNASTGPFTADSKTLDDIVTSYNELNSKVPGFPIPIKLGHNKKVGEPAYGYAQNVRRKGNTLIADFADVPPELVDAIGQRRYNSVSVEIWPKVEHAGRTFSHVLSGVALLGAEWPAVKGLAPIYASEFADGAPLMLSQAEESDMPNFTQEQHDAILAAAVAKAKDDAKAEFTAQIDTLTQERDIAQAALDAFGEEKEKAEITAIIKAAEDKGAIVPANKPKIEAFAETIRTSVAKGDARKSLVAQFKDFVEALPPKVKFGENGAANEDRPGSDNVQQEINAKVAQARKGDKTLSYKDALDLVFSENPELKTRYAEER